MIIQNLLKILVCRVTSTKIICYYIDLEWKYLLTSDCIVIWFWWDYNKIKLTLGNHCRADCQSWNHPNPLRYNLLSWKVKGRRKRILKVRIWYYKCWVCESNLQDSEPNMDYSKMQPKQLYKYQSKRLKVWLKNINI